MSDEIGPRASVALLPLRKAYRSFIAPAIRRISGDRLARLRENLEPLIDAEWYGKNFGVPSAEAYIHYMNVGEKAGASPNEFFDAIWYLETYPDVRAAGMSPLVHYALHGWREGRNPSPLFDNDRYLLANPDVRAAGKIPLAHYLRSGRVEKRSIFPVADMASTPSRDPELKQVAVDRSVTDALDLATDALVRCLAPLCAVTGPVAIVFALPLFGRGGSEKAALSFAKAFLERQSGKSALLLITDRPTLDESMDLPAATHVMRLSDFCPNLDRDGRMEFLFRVLHAIRPEVFHIINSDLAWRLLARKGERVKALTRVFGSMFCVQRDYDTKALIGYAATYLAAARDHCERLLTDNEAFALEAARVFPCDAPDCMLPVYNPVSWKEAETRRFQQKEPGPSSQPAVLWAGRLDRQKRVELLFEIAKRLPSVRFYLYGGVVTDGDAALEKLPNVEFCGEFGDPRQLFLDRSYHAYVHTTYEEGLPNILLEVGGCGTPIVAPAIGGIGELINEKTGFLLPADADSGDYERALRLIFAEPTQARRRAAELRSLICERHSWRSFRAAVAAIPNYLEPAERKG